MGGRRFKLSTNEIKWIISSLNHDITETKSAMDSASDDSPIQAFGELMVENRENLVRKLYDIISCKVKTVSID